MNNNDLYQSWLEKKKNVGPRADFSKNITTRILQYEQKKHTPKSRWEISEWLEWISLRPVMQTALITAGFIAGAVRLVLTLKIILSF